MLLVPTGQTNDEGLPIQLHQATLARLAGADVNASWHAPRDLPWSTHLAMSYVDAEDESGDALPWTPPATGRFEIRRSWNVSGKSKGASSMVLEASRDAVLVHASTFWRLGRTHSIECPGNQCHERHLHPHAFTVAKRGDSRARTKRPCAGSTPFEFGQNVCGAASLLTKRLILGFGTESCRSLETTISWTSTRLPSRARRC